MKRLKARLLPMALGLLLAVLCLPGTAQAYDRMPSTRDLCSLTLTCKYEGVEYDLYRVCNVDDLANFTPTEEFSEWETTIVDLIAKHKWERLTDTLVVHLAGKEADNKGLKPYISAVSDKDGKAVFSGLPVGLYLVIGHQKEIGPQEYYIPTDFMVCLPNWERTNSNGTSSSDGDWNYDVSVVNKGTEKNGETIKLGALKKWETNMNHPTSVTVQLMRRERKAGSQYEPYGPPVTLSQKEGFDTLWTDLDNVNYEWKVREMDVPDEYLVSYNKSGVTIIITNSDKPNNPPPTPDKPGSDPDPDPPKSDPDPDPPHDPNKPDKPNKPNDPDDPSKPSDPNKPNDPPGDPSDPPDGPPNIPCEDIDDPDPPLSKPPVEEEEIDEWDPEEEEDIDDPDTPLARLPQTGVLWWPVPFLAMGGLFLFVLGWALNWREYEE